MNLRRILNNFSPFTILLICLLGTALATGLAFHAVEVRHQSKISEITHRVHSSISNRLERYERALVQLRAFILTANNISRDTFRLYIKRLNLLDQYPGIQGLGYTIRVPPENLEQHISEVRSQGFKEYVVWPEGKRENYFSIIYIEPFDWRNQRAFGYDMFSDPIRREAMERARVTGEIAVTSMVELVQETGEKKQKGFLIYLPVFDNGRKDNLIAYVYAPFRAEDFFSAIFLKDLQTHRDAHVQIFEKDGTGPHHMFFDNNILFKSTVPTVNTPIWKTHLNFGGRDWLISIQQRPDTEYLLEKWFPYIICLIGLIFSSLIYWITSTSRKYTLETQMNLGKLDAIMTNLSEGLIFADAQSNITMMNPEALRIHEFSSLEEMVTKLRDYENLYSLHEISGEEIPLSKWPISRILSGERFVDYEIKVSRSDTQKSWIGSFSGTPIYDKDGKVELAVLTVRDVTEKKSTDLEYKKRGEELSEALRTRDEFISIASHELKTPLTSLKLQSQLMNRKIGKASEELLPKSSVTGFIEQIEKQVFRLTRLVDDMLDIARINTGRLTIVKDEVEICHLLRDLLHRMHSDFVDARYEIPKIECNGEFVGEWDLIRLEQVFINLFTNAIKYGNGKPVSISVEAENSFVTVAIRDRGMGIPKESLGKVFDRFQRLVEGSSITGLGLGLFLSKQIVVAHGGKIWVESSEGEGSVFYVTLPRKTA